MDDARAQDDGGSPEHSPVLVEAVRLFNHWLECLDKVVNTRSGPASDAARDATAALYAHLDSHPDADELTPVRERLAIVFERLRNEKARGPAPDGVSPPTPTAPEPPST